MTHNGSLHFNGGEPYTVQRAQRSEATNAEPIAIIGMGCRFPGASDLASFWDLICNGKDAIGEVPADRFDIDAVYDARPATTGKIMSRWGGFLEHIDQFDASFFGIAPREAARMDPQHRLLLEVAYEAMEDAGQVPEKLSDVLAGVFIGIITSDYWDRHVQFPSELDVYSTAGSARSGAAGRISYALGLQGISVAVDAACSSSLVAVHLACQSLRTGSCKLALAGGVNIILNPDLTIGYSQGKMMASDGHCKTFDVEANGYVRSEGAGVVVLKPLSLALEDGDSIYAVIRGSAANNDGHSDLFMTPSIQGQQAVLRQAYRDAGVEPGMVQYVETHGTGTSVGDPVELKALGSILAEGRPSDSPCIVGSVKTNIGHTEGAAGLAGLIKVALCLKHGVIPGNLHFHHPNPAIPWDKLPLRVAQGLQSWPIEQGPRLAGVSSFGIAGTNAHLVLQSAPSVILPVDGSSAIADDRPYILTLSAQSEAALQAMAHKYQAFFQQDDHRGTRFRDICYTASVRRTHHDFRLALVGNSRSDASEKLQAYLAGQMNPAIITGRKQFGRANKVVWIFPGQGSQWPGMGRELMELEPIFRIMMEQCDRVMRRYVNWSLLEELQADEEHAHLDRIDVVQPMLFAMQVSLATLWRSWGVVPDAVVGHSMGEVAAAFVAGALCLEDAAWIICGRSKLLLRTSGKGAMAAVELSMDEARSVLTDYADRVSIAVNNSPHSTVLSGDPTALSEILHALEERGVFGRLVKVNVASHSPQMDELRDELLSMLAHIQPRASRIPLYSTVIGEIVDGRQMTARYWVKNLREPVLFATSLQQLLREGFDTFMEMSPHPILTGAVRQCMQHEGKEGLVLASLRREEPERAMLCTALATLYATGFAVRWPYLYRHQGRHVSLPTYPWQRERFWNTSLEALRNSTVAATFWRGAGTTHHPLLGPVLRSALHQGTCFWETNVSVERFPYLQDHCIHGMVVLPSTGYLEIALAAASETFGPKAFLLEDIRLVRALFFPEGESQSVQVALSAQGEKRFSLHIFGKSAQEHKQVEHRLQDEPWTLYASATIALESFAEEICVYEFADVIQSVKTWETTIVAREHYQTLHERGIEHGPLFQGITQLWRRDCEVIGQLHIPTGLVAELACYHMHPALFDTFLQAIMTFLPGETGEDTYVPVEVEQIRLHRSPVADEQLWCHALLRGEHADNQSRDTFEGDVFLLDEHGNVLIEVFGFRLQRLGGDSVLTQQMLRRKLSRLLYAVQWEAEPLPERVSSQETSSAANWLILSDRRGVGQHLVNFLEELNVCCVTAVPGDSFQELGVRKYQVDPSSPESFEQLLTTAFDGGDCQQIVYLWGLDIDGLREEANWEHVESDQDKDTARRREAGSDIPQGIDYQAGGIGVVSLLQALTAIGEADAPRLWLVSAGAQAVNENDRLRAFPQALLWGLGRVIVYEHADLHCTLLDLDESCSPASLDAMCHEMWVNEAVDELALRNGQRYIARLGHYQIPQDQELVSRVEDERLLSDDATYLITGGLGGVGFRVAQWMVEQGARHLVLIGRSSPSAQVQQRLQMLREQAPDIRVIQADVSQRCQIADVLSLIRRYMPPLRGVIHSAVVLNDCILLQQDQQRFLSVMPPKVDGAWNLHQVTLEEPLDFFVMFSSAASLIGSPGQGNYAAANAFLDALAFYRRAHGYPALSINWGRWAEVGQALIGDRGERLDSRGFASMSPLDGLNALGYLLRQHEPQVGVMAFDLQKWCQFYPAVQHSSLFTLLAQDAVHGIGTDEAADCTLTREMLQDLSTDQQHEALESYVSAQIAHVLGLSGTRVDGGVPLNRLGIDSLMSVELRNRINADLDVVIPVATFLQGIVPAQLVNQIEQTLAG